MADSNNVTEVLTDCGCEAVTNASDVSLVSGLSKGTYQKRSLNGLNNARSVYLVDSTDEDKDAGGSRIVNVGNPVVSTDAANKKYVDETISCKLACSSGLARDNKKRIDFLEPSYNNLAKRFQYLDKKYFYLVDRYNEFQGEIHIHNNKEDVLDLLTPNHVALLGGKEGEVTYHKGDNSVYFKKIMNISVHICTSTDEVEECKTQCKIQHQDTSHYVIYYNADNIKGSQIYSYASGNWQVLSASYTTDDAAKSAICDVIGVGRYCYNTLTGRFFWCESRSNPIKELDFNAFYIGKTAPDNTSLLWLYPDDDITKPDVTRLDNLQYQIYKLGLQVKDLNRLLETGCVPGDVDSNYKNELIEYGEMLQPDEITNYDELTSVSVYGLSNAQNYAKYYCLFNPSSFVFDETGVKWSFVGCDTTTDGAKIPLQKTLTTRYYPDRANDPSNYTDYKLRCRLERVNEDVTQPLNDSGFGIGDSHLCYRIKYSVVNASGGDVWNQSDINEAIERILADTSDADENGLKPYQLQIQLETTEVDENEDTIVGESPVLTIAKNSLQEEADTTFVAQVTGPDYCDDGSNYYVVFNENTDGVTDMKLHSSCKWYFKDSEGNKVTKIYQYKTEEDASGNVTVTDEITHTIEILNPLTPVATMSIVMADGYSLKDMETTKVELFVESTINTEICATKEINVGGLQPTETDIEPTVHAVCAKLGTAQHFNSYKSTLYDGELIYFTDQKKFVVYYDGNFYAASGSSNSSSGSTDGISLSDLLSLKLPYLNFEHNGSYFRLYVDDKGRVHTLQYNDDEKATDLSTDFSSWGVHVRHTLGINSFYCGGSDSSYTKACSHNFVELANGSDDDINLNGMYLLYTDSIDTTNTKGVCKWEILKLKGIIKAGGTFLIRGAECNPEKDAFIKVDSYDLEWRTKASSDYSYDDTETDYERTGDLITFSQDRCSFYLVNGFANLSYVEENKTPYATSVPDGYVDLVGVRKSSVQSADVPAENAAMAVDGDWNNILFYRWFSLDPSKQANKKYSERKTATLWTYIDLTKHSGHKDNSIQYYYPDYLKQKFAPKATYENKSFFSNKTTFRSDRPNMVNLTFGRQATETMNGTVGNADAARCLNWISVGYYDEFVEYKKTTDTSWTRVYSITADDSNAYVDSFHAFYDRFRWTASDGTLVTTHKALIHGLSAGDYEYRVGRDDDVNYLSETMKFTVRNDTQVKTFSFIQTTDQQGFNWLEYQAWARSCDMIADTEVNSQGVMNFDFTINTGDITQSGNRVNEWLDYYEGRKSIRSKEEMFTVGNNDLCGQISTRLTDGEDATSKYNQINSFRYYTFELDPNNAANHFCTYDGTTYPIYSLYSFNYGSYHFVCLNSEVSKYYGKSYGVSDDTQNVNITTAINGKIEQWFTRDLQIFKGITNTSQEPTNCQKCVVYMHEMPFTILTNDVMKQSSERKNGCKLNDYNTNGKFRFSRLFKKYGIRLVMGGHKHTFCITKPIYDAPEGYLTNNVADPDKLFDGDITAAMSIKPVIQVLSANDIPTEEAYTKYARYEVVSKISAPTYVMCQATGYKLVSNKELPAFDWDIPWMLSYFKTTGSDGSAVENTRQHRPMYIRYDLTDSDIVLTVKQVDNVWVTTNSSKKYDINSPKSQLYVVPMTFGMDSTNTNIPTGYVSDYYAPTVAIRKNSPSNNDWNTTATQLNIGMTFTNANSVSYNGTTSYKLDTTV